MKTFLLVQACQLMFCCCNWTPNSDPVQRFIPGTYIRFSEHEFGTEYDTLVLTLQNKVAYEYKILRKWKYERILDGTPMKAEYKRLSTSGIYDTRYKVLRETETGDLYSFDVHGKLLFNGPIKYQKL